MRMTQRRAIIPGRWNTGFLAGAVALGTALAIGPLTPASGAVAALAAAPSPPSGWRTTWTDDFTGSGRLSNNWIYRTGTQIPGGPANFGTGEIEVDTDATTNVAQRDGSLHIKAIRDGQGGWTSGRIETSRDDFQPPAGGQLAVEGRMQLPDLTGAAAAGYWPAFWILGTPYRGNLWNWPGIGELDIMENVQGLNTNWGTMHCGTSPGGECNEQDGRSGNTPGGSPSLQAGMHTYRLEWDESKPVQQMRWYLDGRLFHTVNQNEVSAATWSAAFDHGYYLILNLAIGGQFPAKQGGGPTAATASGGELVVDYVTVQTKDGGGAASGPTPTSRPSPAPGTPTPSPVPTTPAPTGTAGGGTSSSTIQAESFSAQSGAVVEATSDDGGGSDVGFLRNGDWLRFDKLNLGAKAPVTFSARVASGITNGRSGLVEVRLDSPTSPVISSFAIANTGGWQSWRTVPSNMDAYTGRHDVYLTFTSGQVDDFVNVNWFTFR